MTAAHMKVWAKAVATGALIRARSSAGSGASRPLVPPADDRAAALSCWRTTASSAVPIEPPTWRRVLSAAVARGTCDVSSTA